MTLPALNRCMKCGTARHIYLLVENSDGAGKVCKEQNLCRLKVAQKQRTEESACHSG